MFHDVDALSGQVTLLAKAQNIYPCTGTNGRKENLERAGSASNRRLVGGDGEGFKVGVHA
jgi:hypothetical protein